MTAIDLSPHTARARLAGLVRRSAYDDDRGVVEHYARAVWSCLVEPGDAVAGRLVGAVVVCASVVRQCAASPIAAAPRAEDLRNSRLVFCVLIAMSPKVAAPKPGWGSSDFRSPVRVRIRT